jgi:two-component system NtrC family sensor kinase
MSDERILIIDDSIAIASLLVNEILPLGGYSATAALSGEEGLEIARQVKPDLILCDLEMPDINGLDVLRELQRTGLDIPAIMMTAFGSEAIAAQALRIGVKDYIIKPFTTEEILASVERALAESRLRQQLETATEGLERYQQALLIVHAISKAAGTGLEPDELVSRILLATVHGGKAQGGFISRLDSQTGKLEVLAVANLANFEGKLIEIRSDKAMAEAIDTAQVVERNSQVGRWFYIPLVRQQATIGLMSIVSRHEARPRSMEYLFSALASFAAMAIENVQLRSELAIAMLQREPES